MNEAPHPDNEPGKSYHVDNRRIAALIADCEGLPTEWFERGLVKELYKLAAFLALAEILADENGHAGPVSFPRIWWEQHVGEIKDNLNRIATKGQLQ